jgi:hypothetical protein
VAALRFAQGQACCRFSSPEVQGFESPADSATNNPQKVFLMHTFRNAVGGKRASIPAVWAVPVSHAASMKHGIIQDANFSGTALNTQRNRLVASNSQRRGSQSA